MKLCLYKDKLAVQAALDALKVDGISLVKFDEAQDLTEEYEAVFIEYKVLRHLNNEHLKALSKLSCNIFILNGHVLIKEILSPSYKGIQNKLIKGGIGRPANKKRNDKIIRMIEEGYSYSEIMKKLNVSKQHIVNLNRTRNNERNIKS